MSTSLSLLNNSGCIIFSLCVLIYVLHCLLCLRCRRNRVSATGPAAGDSQAAGNAGLNQSAIDLLPSFAYHDDKCAAATEECAVCLSHVEEGEMVRLLQCGHAFHMACVDVWLHAHALCPLCRAEAKPPEEKVAAGGDRSLKGHLKGH